MSAALSTSCPSGRPGAVVVLVDDDPLQRSVFAEILEETGFRIVPFSDGPSALSYLRNGGEAAAILLDWSMPHMDGAEVLRRLRADGHAVPVLFLTGYTEQVFEEAALTSGAADFVPKTKGSAILAHRLELAIASEKRPAVTAEPGSVGLHIDDECARAYWNGEPVLLTLNEVKVVRLLVGRAGRHISYREIYDFMRGEGFHAGSGENGYRTSVRATIKRIRTKFAAADPAFGAIGNQAGLGYYWRDFAALRSPAA